MRTQQKAAACKRIPIRVPPCWHPDLDLPAFQLLEIHFCCLIHPAYGILLRQPELANTYVLGEEEKYDWKCGGEERKKMLGDQAGEFEFSVQGRGKRLSLLEKRV